MKTALREIEAGKVILYRGKEVVVLGHQGDKTLVLCKESIGNMPFDKDNSNDWKESSLRRYLNSEFLNNLLCDSEMEREIPDSEVDLTADDGLDDYGISQDKIFLLTCEQYRKYRKVIPNLEDWWWLVTPYSTKENRYADSVSYVYSDGTLSNEAACYGHFGVRPAWYLKSEILVSDSENGCMCEHEGIKAYSTKQLLEELIRREGENNYEDENEE